MTQWVLLNDKWAIVQLYHGKKKLQFDKMIMMMFTLYLTNKFLQCYLTEKYTGRHVVLLRHMILFCIWANQPMLLLLNAACLPVLIMVFSLTWLKRPEKIAKGSFFPPVSVACTNKLYISRKYTYCLYTSLYDNLIVCVPVTDRWHDIPWKQLSVWYNLFYLISVITVGKS